MISFLLPPFLLSLLCDGVHCRPDIAILVARAVPFDQGLLPKCSGERTTTGQTSHVFESSHTHLVVIVHAVSCVSSACSALIDQPACLLKMMRSLLLLALCVCTALGAPSTPPLAKRDNAPIDSPSGTYAPLRVDCPANLAVRLPPTPQGALNTEEAAYIARRQTASLPAWRTYLANVALDDFDIDAFLAGGVPVTGAAVSGGGLRAMLHGGTVLNGLDARNEEAVEARTGGVLQVLTYLSGLSGGGWMTGSWALANAPTFTNLNEEIWNLEVGGFTLFERFELILR